MTCWIFPYVEETVYACSFLLFGGRNLRPRPQFLFTDAQGNLMIAYHAEDALEHHLRYDGIHRVHFNIHGEPVFDLSAKRDLDPALSQVEMEVIVG